MVALATAIIAVSVVMSGSCCEEVFRPGFSANMSAFLAFWNPSRCRRTREKLDSAEDVCFQADEVDSVSPPRFGGDSRAVQDSLTDVRHTTLKPRTCSCWELPRSSKSLRRFRFCSVAAPDRPLPSGAQSLR